MPAPKRFPSGKDRVKLEAIKVLLVEDDPVFMTLVLSMLETRSFAVERAVSAEEALTILKTRNFDLLITDLKMEGLGGVGLIQALMLSGAFPKKRIVVITGEAPKSADCVWVREQGIPLVEKPFGMKSLFEAVDSLL